MPWQWPTATNKAAKTSFVERKHFQPNGNKLMCIYPRVLDILPLYTQIYVGIQRKLKSNFVLCDCGRVGVAA